MHKSWEIIKELEAYNSRIYKESIIEREANSNNDNFFNGCKLALDKLISFGIKQISISSQDGEGLNWNEFLNMCKKLISREITGNSARELINLNMKKSKSDQWNFWFRRILLKDLNCGVSEKTINNVIKKLSIDKYKIPVFACMLAHDSNNHEKKMVGEKLIDFKLDGIRVIAIYNYENKCVNLFSRNGKELFNFEHISSEINQKLTNSFNESMVLDGEVVSKTFQLLMKQVYNKSNTVASDAKLALFDILPLKEFLIGESSLGCLERHKILKNLFIKNDTQSIYLLNKKLLNLDKENGKNEFKSMNKIAIEKGYEGIIFKSH